MFAKFACNEAASLVKYDKSRCRFEWAACLKVALQVETSSHPQHNRHALHPCKRFGLGAAFLPLRAARRQAVLDEPVVDARVICIHIPAHNDNQARSLPPPPTPLLHLSARATTVSQQLQHSHCIEQRVLQAA